MPKRHEPAKRRKSAIEKAAEARHRGKFKFKFNITDSYRSEVAGLVKRIIPRLRKRPLGILIVCPEGIFFSHESHLMMRYLLQDLGLHNRVKMYNDSVKIDGQRIDILKKIDYVIPRYSGEADYPMQNLKRRVPGTTAEHIPNNVLTTAVLTDPEPYKQLLLDVLKREVEKMK